MPQRDERRPAPRQNAIFLRLGIARLRFASRLTYRRLRRLKIKADRERGIDSRPPPRRWLYLVALSVCLAAAISGIVVSVLDKGVPALRTLDGSIPGAEELLVLDPDRKDEMHLSPGYLYDRPVAAVQTGTEPVLLRMRLEETLLTAKHNESGRVTAFKPMRDPGETWSPRTMTQDEALYQLAGGGWCDTSDSWEDVLEKKLPARRLPGGDNNGGRLLVFEKKTIITDPDSPIPEDLVDVLLPEDIEAYGLGMIIYSYTGFYYIKQGSQSAYQPLRVTAEDHSPRRPTQKPPAITGIAYEFYAWEVTQSRVHKYGEDPEAPVNLQTGELKPLTEWHGPEDAWFYDATDGWVYYGQALPSGAMTPLLLRSYAVWPDRPLRQDETRYRLTVRAQSVPFALDASLKQEEALAQLHGLIVQQWHSGALLGSLGRSYMTNEAAVFARSIMNTLHE